MCTRITQNNIILHPGSRAIITTQDKRQERLTWGEMSGAGRYNARLETIKEKWLIKGYLVGTLKAEGFFEKDKLFCFKKAKNIGIIYIPEDHFIVVTEPSNIQVARIHHRQPCFENIEELLRA